MALNPFGVVCELSIDTFRKGGEDAHGYMTVSDVGRMAMCSSSSEFPLYTSVDCLSSRPRGVDTYALVTQATSGANPSIWSFSFSSLALETNMGK